MHCPLPTISSLSIAVPLIPLPPFLPRQHPSLSSLSSLSLFSPSFVPLASGQCLRAEHSTAVVVGMRAIKGSSLFISHYLSCTVLSLNRSIENLSYRAFVSIARRFSISPSIYPGMLQLIEFPSFALWQSWRLPAIVSSKYSPAILSQP